MTNYSLLTILSSLVCFGQATLLIHRESEIGSQAGGTAAIVNPIRCDSSSNIYFRGFEPPNSQLPLLRLSSDGKKAATFRAEESSNSSNSLKDEFELKSVVAFAVHSDGGVFHLVIDTKDRPSILEFAKDGTFKRVIKLDRDWEPTGLAVFASGGFLVSGMAVMTRDPFQAKPVIALFDDRGRFVKSVETGESPTTDADLARQAGLGMVESGSDYVYILRQATKPFVLLISPAGEVLKRLPIDPPKDMAISDLRVGPGRMLVRFFAPATGTAREKAVFSLYDNMEGRKLLDYEEAPGVSGIFACFDWKNTFSYLSLDERGQRTLVNATVR